jgi:hypothetical protein
MQTAKHSSTRLITISVTQAAVSTAIASATTQEGIPPHHGQPGLTERPRQYVKEW